MTAWEIAMLVAKGKMALAMSPDTWFERFCELPGVALAKMSPSVLTASANLPGATNRMEETPLPHSRMLSKERLVAPPK